MSTQGGGKTPEGQAPSASRGPGGVRRHPLWAALGLVRCSVALGPGPPSLVLTPAPLRGLFLHARVTDEVFNFLLVWYYCTLTIRESILISNGSR